ncbi:MAG: hypothetical protein HY275_17050 [Gemmatimonadetes bacterium]|nr:hypothetical protein [Gemmatimonadota bacterium]
MRARWIVVVVLPLTTLAAQSRQAPAGAGEGPVLVKDTAPVDGDPRGTLGQPYLIESAILHERRRVFITLPPSYAKSAATRHYPVTVATDGEDVPGPLAAVSEHLGRMGQIPESIIIGIENTVRIRDLTPPGISVSGSTRKEGGDRFLDFIERELLPAVDRQLRGGAPRTFVGHSSGGILATWVAATRPAFRNVVAIDTPTWFDDYWLPKQLIARATKAPGALRYVSYESRFGWTDAMWKQLVAAAPPAWRLHREHLDRESHESMVMLSGYLGLREVFADYSMLAAPESPTLSTLRHYDTVSAALGAPVIPPRRLLQQVIEDLAMEGQGRAARSAYTMLVEGYGAPRNDAALRAQVVAAERRPPLTETVESLLATPMPSPEAMRPWLGEWVGDVWMNADELRTGRETLRFWVENGTVKGESISRPAKDVELRQVITYLRVTDSGLTYGFMNGMRPRGMLLHEGTMQGDAFTGTMRLGGVVFERPDGSKAPPLYFAFKRARPR